MRAACAIAALAVLVSLASCRSPPKCNCQCSVNYDPVCAVDSKGVEETYPNECSFECYKCTHSKHLVIRNRGECTNKSNGTPSGRNEKQKTASGNSNAQSISPSKCNCKCPYNYVPVCAVDSKGITETYPNQCAFECYKCTHGKDLRIQSRRECPEQGTLRPTPGTVQKPRPNGQCNCDCTFEYAPVCAGDSKGFQETYPSACSFECYKCTHGKDLRILKRGECSKETSSRRPSPGKCNCQCPLNYNPVCAVDPRGNEETYPNSCSFECYKCTHGKELRLLKRGECSGKTTARPPRPRPPNRTRPTISNKNCNNACPAIYSPICAVNSKGIEKTFSNRCVLDGHNCQYNEDFVARRSGDCEGRFPQILPRVKTRTA